MTLLYSPYLTLANSQTMRRWTPWHFRCSTLTSSILTWETLHRNRMRISSRPTTECYHPSALLILSTWTSSSTLTRMNLATHKIFLRPLPMNLQLDRRISLRQVQPFPHPDALRGAGSSLLGEDHPPILRLFHMESRPIKPMLRFHCISSLHFFLHLVFCFLARIYSCCLQRHLLLPCNLTRVFSSALILSEVDTLSFLCCGCSQGFVVVITCYQIYAAFPLSILSSHHLYPSKESLHHFIYLLTL